MCCFATTEPLFVYCFVETLLLTFAWKVFHLMYASAICKLEVAYLKLPDGVLRFNIGYSQ